MIIYRVFGHEKLENVIIEIDQCNTIRESIKKINEVIYNRFVNQHIWIDHKNRTIHLQNKRTIRNIGKQTIKRHYYKPRLKR